MLAAILFSCFGSLPVASPAVVPRPCALPMVAFLDRAPVAACVAPSDPPPADGDGAAATDIAIEPKRVSLPPSVEWKKLGRDSIRFLAVMHAFRWATEPGTRNAGIGIGSGYTRSIGNLHGWADGDPFYVNYVGHPFQGAVAGRLFLLNSPRYRQAEFGSDAYWKGQLRAAAFAWAFSEQFEIGPLSEASIGHIQRDFPQQGFVDHVITPTVGFAWMLAEDALDRYAVRAFEDRIANPWLRFPLRIALNPTRTFANILNGKIPWYRSTRAGVLTYTRPPKTARAGADRAGRAVSAPVEAKAPTFEFSMEPGWRQFAGGECVGGGAEVAYRLTPDVQMALAVNGCKLLGLPRNVSGDALVYQVGPRWTPWAAGRWSPYAHLLVGGVKITHEQFYPDKKLAVEEANKNLDPMLSYRLHEQYTRREEASGVAITAGTGVDYKLNEALAIRVARVEYLRSSVTSLGGLPYSSGLQVTTGMVLRLGTW